MQNKTKKIIEFLQTKGVVLEKGLTEDEFNILENKFGQVFPPDLKKLLALALPVSQYFPNWRKLIDGSDKYLKESINHPIEGVLFDVEVNNFWYPNWGEKPNNIPDALKVAKEELKKVPKLTRVYGIRYIPSEPLEEGNPIFSIHQTDIMYWMNNLENYFLSDFGHEDKFKNNKLKVKRIPFWSDLAGLAGMFYFE